MKRNRMLAVAGVVVIIIAFIAFVVAPNIGGGQQTSFNVVRIIITNWDLNKTIEAQGIDVQFIISIDITGDGVYESVKPSDVFTNTTVEVAPFESGGPVATTIPSFKFKVEAFKLVGGELQQLYYTANGTTPVNQGTNDADAQQSWSYDATWIEGANDYACRISYVYYVNNVS
jgi:hypothetical protein